MTVDSNVGKVILGQLIKFENTQIIYSVTCDFKEKGVSGASKIVVPSIQKANIYTVDKDVDHDENLKGLAFHAGFGAANYILRESGAELRIYGLPQGYMTIKPID